MAAAAPAGAEISIHAPVKGATPGHQVGAQPYQISIHAPVKGATKHELGRHPSDYISIHAPVKGATREAERILCFHIFQSTLP